MDHTKPPRQNNDEHTVQRDRVASSVLRSPNRDTYRKRILSGTSAATVRDAVRVAVLASLRDSNRTHADAAEAGAMAVDHALAQVGIQVQPVGYARMGWRGRCAHILLQLENGNTATAQSELRGLIDGIYGE